MSSIPEASAHHARAAKPDVDWHELEQSANKIREEIREERAAYNAAIEHAIVIGEELIAIKEKIVHGEWGNWVYANFEYTQATANNYMRIARHAETVRASGATSLRDALAGLSSKRETEKATTRIVERATVAPAETPMTPEETAEAQSALSRSIPATVEKPMPDSWALNDFLTRIEPISGHRWLWQQMDSLRTYVGILRSHTTSEEQGVKAWLDALDKHLQDHRDQIVVAEEEER